MRRRERKVTIREFYERTGGDYAGIMERFAGEKRVEKFAVMFLEDPCYEQLEKNLSEGNIREAFQAVHTLKGVCLNIGFSRLYKSVFQVTEALRVSDLAAAQEKMETLRKDYLFIVKSLKELDS